MNKKQQREIEDYEAMLRVITLSCKAALNQVRETAKRELPGYVKKELLK